MSWLTSNLFSLSAIGGLLFLGSFIRVRFVKPHRPAFAIGIILFLAVGIGLLKVVYGTPGQEDTVDDKPLPTPIPIVDSAIKRLQSTWDSESIADWRVAETLAAISETAYLSPVEADAEFRAIGFDDVMPIVAGSMIGYVISKDEGTVIAFRGTDGGEVSDWLANLGRSTLDTPHGQIHRGFYFAYQSLQPQIMTILSKKPHKHLWITGHSLGGALALVCTYDLIESEKLQVDGLMTFGQPMVARQNLAEHLDTLLLGRYAHFVNKADLVPRVPPSYVHCGSLVWFTDDGIKRSKPKRPVFGAVATNNPETVVGTDKEISEMEIDDLTPLSDGEFQRLQSKLKTDRSAAPPPPDGPIAYTAGPGFIEDHAMALYLDRVQHLLGITNPK